MLRGNSPPVSRRATYEDFLELTDSDAPHDPIAWADVVSAVAEICRLDRDAPLLSASLNAGVTLPADGIVKWRFEPEDLGSLRAGDYRLLVRLTTSAGDTVELLDAILPLT